MADDADTIEAARAQAEARRKKILEKAQTRMDKVSGEVGVDEEEKKQSASNAARIRAARQRRYRKKNKTDSENPTAAESTGIEKQDEPSKSGGNAEATTTAETKEVEESVKQKAPVDSEDSQNAARESSLGDEPKKKYVGVAKMRRKLIMKKKMEAEEGKSEDSSTENASHSKVEMQSTPPIVKIPVYMHVVTIFLLFFAGVDVGLQQYHEDVTIHDQVVFKEYGIPLIHGGPSKSLGTINGVESLGSDEVIEDSDLHEEFEPEDTEESFGGNIDPLFKVDLDELTKGPGIMYQLARGAVALHRLIMQLLYHAPLSIFYSLLALPEALMQAPPLLCLVALVLRQIVGKRILKAGIPQPETDEKDAGIDVVAVVKQAAIAFVSSSFPNAVGLYDMFSHLRSDMYIIMCGVFFGLAWTHLSADMPIQGNSDETAGEL